MITRYLAVEDITFPEMACDSPHAHAGGDPSCKSEPDTSNGDCEKEAAALGWVSMSIDGERVHFCPDCAPAVRTPAEARGVLRLGPKGTVLGYEITTAKNSVDIVAGVKGSTEFVGLAATWGDESNALRFRNLANAVTTARDLRTHSILQVWERTAAGRRVVQVVTPRMALAAGVAERGAR